MRLTTYFFILVFSLISLFSISNMAFSANVMPLPADQAFQLSVSFVRPHVVMAHWHIAPSYYLYTKRTKITFSPNSAVTVNYPEGESRYDEEHGRYEVYSGDVSVPITIPANTSPTQINIEYQGCSQNGFCYPPIAKNFMLNTIKMSSIKFSDMTNSTPNKKLSLNALLTDQNGVGKLLEHQSYTVLLFIFAGLGLLLAFTPCVLPMIPILTSIIVGQKHAPGTKKAFLLSLTYVLGMSMTYACAGLVAASLGSSIQVWLQKPITIIIVSGVFVFLALSLFGLYELRFSTRWHNWIYSWSNKHQGGTYVGVYFMGALATLVVSPCVTAPLVGVLIYIGQTGNLAFGASALFAMGLGMGIPLLLIGMSAGKWLPKSGPWMKAVKEMFGIFMVAMAIWLLSRIVSPAVTRLLFGILLLATAGFVGMYLPRLIHRRKTNRTIGLAIGLCGIFLVLNGFNMTMTIKSVSAQVNAPTFIVVHNMADLNKQLARAQIANRPVILDFYADWCTSCVAMDRHVFNVKNVQQALHNFILLRADLSKNTDDDQEMLKRFGVIAPPTMLFFNNAGQEVNSHRIIGELDANEFLVRLDSFITASCDKKVQC